VFANAKENRGERPVERRSGSAKFAAGFVDVN
jgi:hypothetical protein